MTEFEKDLDRKCSIMEEASHQIHLSLDGISKQLATYDQQIGKIIDQVRNYHINDRPEDWYNNELLIDFKKQLKEKFKDKVVFNNEDKEDKEDPDLIIVKTKKNKLIFKLNNQTYENSVGLLCNVFSLPKSCTDLISILETLENAILYLDQKKEILSGLDNIVKITDNFSYQIKENIQIKVVFEDDEILAQAKTFIVEELLSRKDTLEIGLSSMKDEGKLMVEYRECIEKKEKLVELFRSISDRLTQSMPPALLDVMFKSYLNQYAKAYQESRQLIDKKKLYDVQRIEVHNLIAKLEKTSYLNSDELDNVKNIQKRSDDELNQLLGEIRIRIELIEKFVRSPAIKDFKKVMRESLNMICQICYQYKIDRSLKCGHLYCHDCLNKMKRGTSRITCAFCNQISSTADCGRCSENTIRNIYLSSGGS